MRPVVLRCPQCGGDFEVTAGKTLSCGYCDHEDQLLAVNAIVPEDAYLQLPSSISEKAARRTLGIECQVEEPPQAQIIWFPFWVLEGEYEAHYTYANEEETLSAVNIVKGRDVLKLGSRVAWGPAARAFNQLEAAAVEKAPLDWKRQQPYQAPAEDSLRATLTGESVRERAETGYLDEVETQLRRRYDQVLSCQGRFKLTRTLLIYRPLWRLQSDKTWAWVDAVSGRLLYSGFPPSGLRRWIRQGLAIPSRFKERVFG